MGLPRGNDAGSGGVFDIVSLGMPVRDMTGLTGRYDFTLKEVDLSPGEDRVFSYPLEQLGLKIRAGTENRRIWWSTTLRGRRRIEGGGASA